MILTLCIHGKNSVAICSVLFLTRLITYYAHTYIQTGVLKIYDSAPNLASLELHLAYYGLLANSYPLSK